MHLGTQHLHPLDVRVLTLHISGTHEHLTLHAHQRTDRCRRHTMLSGSCLCDDTRLAHLLGQQDLTHGVVDLVSARVVQVLALQIESATITLTHPLRQIERRRPAYIVPQQGMIRLLEVCRLDDWQVGFLQVMHTLVENLRHIGTSKLSIESIFVYLILSHIFKSLCVNTQVVN